MCNPRRVMINLTRTIEQSWRTLVEQTARAEGQVQELARISADIPLDAEMGDLALQMLERIMRGDIEGYNAWEQDSEGRYRRDLGDVVLIYQPGSHQLVIEARLTELVSAEARGSAEASGFTVGEVAVEAVGHYYSDNWGGRTEAHARAEAEAQAERNLAAAIEALHRQQHAPALQAAEAEARTRSEQDAAFALRRAQAEMRIAMCERLQVILTNAEDRIYHTMNRLVAEAYRQSLIQLVQQNGGRVLTDERTGSVMNLELEIF